MLFEGTKAGMKVAIKRVDCNKNKIPREVEVHSSLPPHPNIIPLLGVTHSLDGFSVYMCLELSNKSLYQYLHTDPEKEKPSLQQSTDWAMQIAKGVHHLHQHGVLHRDLKSACALHFEKEGIIKIGGFGSPQFLDHTTTVSMPWGSPRWRAPEFFDGVDRKINQRSDVFSYGMVLYEIFAHKLPFHDRSRHMAVDAVRDGKRPPIPPEAPLYIQQLMQSCWKHNPHDRPTFGEILQVGYSDTPMACCVQCVCGCLQYNSISPLQILASKGTPSTADKQPQVKVNVCTT